MSPTGVGAKGPDFSGGALTGISQLYVMVWDLESDVQADGLSVTTLRGDVEQLLSRAGIEVVPTRDYAYALHKGEELPPSLVVDIHTMKISEDTYVANIELEVWASATLADNPGIGVSHATTWRAPAILSTVRRDHLAEINESVKRMVGKFLDEYWSVRLQE
jgi:hypothetical protein